MLQFPKNACNPGDYTYPYYITVWLWNAYNNDLTYGDVKRRRYFTSEHNLLKQNIMHMKWPIVNIIGLIG